MAEKVLRWFWSLHRISRLADSEQVGPPGVPIRMRPNGDRLEQAKQSRERGPDNQGCDEDQGSKCAKALEAGQWTVISKRKGPPRASGTHTSRVRRLSSITREPWRTVIGALGQRWHAAT